MAEIREKALGALTTQAIHDDQFRSEAINDLEGTLRRYGFGLNEQEIQLVRDFQSRVAHMSDEDVLKEVNLLPGGDRGPKPGGRH